MLRTVDTERTRYGSDKTGLLCGYAFGPDHPGVPVDADDAAQLVGPATEPPQAFLWLHFNLSNQASARWLAQHLDPPEGFFLPHHAGSTRVDVMAGSIVASVNDLTIFGPDASEASSMLILVTDRVIATARRTPLRSVDRLRESVRAGERFRSPLELFAHLLRDQAATLAQIVHDATDQVDDVEDRLIANQVASSRSTLGGLRRTLVKVQRLLTPMRATLTQLIAKPPAWLSADDVTDLRTAVDDIAAAATDCHGLIDRIKLLQDEVFALVNEQTNRTLFTLTIVTVLALPMTIVSGFFGMNVSGVPFQTGGAGFWEVVVITVTASALGAVLLSRRRQ
jgi:zinc transporter